MSISKKIRFEVFKRDGFVCAYCGKSPPTVTLEVDHIEPRSKGGKDDLNNLITACFDCNRGKRNIPLDKAPGQLSENLEILQEREDQIKAYRKLVKKVEKRIEADIDDIEDVFAQYYPGYHFTDRFRNGSIKKFVQEIPLEDVKQAMHKACGKCKVDRDGATKYFCGICWNKIKGVIPPWERGK